MRRANALNIQFEQLIDRSLEALCRGTHQVHTTQHGVYRPPAGQLLHVAQRVDHTRVGTAQQYDGTLNRLEVDCLIINERIRAAAMRIEEERTARILEVGNARHWACHDQAIEQERRFFDQN